MKDADNENEPLTFKSLAAATAMATRHLQKQEDGEERPADNQKPERAEQHPEAQREYIEHGLRQIAEFERRAAGLSRGRRKRN